MKAFKFSIHKDLDEMRNNRIKGIQSRTIWVEAKDFVAALNKARMTHPQGYLTLLKIETIYHEAF